MELFNTNSRKTEQDSYVIEIEERKHNKPQWKVEVKNSEEADALNLCTKGLTLIDDCDWMVIQWDVMINWSVFFICDT